MVTKVSMHVALNPVARAVERARIKAWFTDVGLRMRLLENGQQCPQLIYEVAEMISIAIKATEGCDDPSDLRGALTESMSHLVKMTNSGQTWIAEHAEDLIESVDAAVQLVCAVDPREKVKAWAWVERIAKEFA